MTTSTDFNAIIERRGTGSIKWSRYGNDVLPMWVADMDFASPESVIEALQARVRHGIFGYPAEPPELRGLFVDRLARLYNWRVPEESLVFLPNVVTGFNLACHAVALPGIGMIIQTPVYFPVLRVPENTGLRPLYNPLHQAANGRYEIDFDEFERAAEDARVFVLCNPHNPVARAFDRGELERMAEICVRHDVVVCSDEIHADFVFDGRKHVPIASLDSEIASRSITLMAPNKSFNIAGIGCAIAIVTDRQLREGLIAANRGLVSHVSILGYEATLAAYRHGEGWLAELIAYLQGNRDFLEQFVPSRLPGVSLSPMEGTYLAWLDCRDLSLAEPAHEFLLRRARVALNDGATFGPGGEGFVRLNFGCPRATLEEGLERIEHALESR